MSGWKDYGKKSGQPVPRRLRILLVDDEPRILESLEELLRDRYEIFTASGGEEAMRLFAEHHPELVLCDQRMPGETGIDVLSRIKEAEPGTIRILVTGYSDIEVVIRALNEQILHRYITKPWANEKLLEAVEEGAERYLAESGLAGPDAGILF